MIHSKVSDYNYDNSNIFHNNLRWPPTTCSATGAKTAALVPAVVRFCCHDIEFWSRALVDSHCVIVVLSVCSPTLDVLLHADLQSQQCLNIHSTYIYEDFLLWHHWGDFYFLNCCSTSCLSINNVKRMDVWKTGWCNTKNIHRLSKDQWCIRCTKGNPNGWAARRTRTSDDKMT